MKKTILKPAEKALRSYDKPTQIRIIEAISLLPDGDVKKMKGKRNLPLYRLRVGKHRVIYELNDDEITIAKIDTRGDAYKG
ncbi:MAG: type II toxin-antitoxin system RelE/ParE family toxin [Oscillospiraceae bacterium]|nr:type II toxin-antitoxin system RelE/ParE family toxin [Oscillospiraceae bacterium]